MIKACKVDLKVVKEKESYLIGVKGGLWARAENDVILFADKVLGMPLYGWQFLVAKAIMRGDKKIIMNTSRQIGKSTLAAVIALWFAVFNKGGSSRFSNTKVGVISATEGQAMKLMLDIKNLIRVGDEWCKEHYSTVEGDVFSQGVLSYLIDASQGSENTRTAITFKPFKEVESVTPGLLKGSVVGSFIKSLPPTDIVRGNTFDCLIVDEASIIDDDIYSMAISKTGDKFNALRLMTSTPRGHRGFFYEYFDPEEKFGDDSWTRFWFTVDAIKLEEPEEHKARMKDIKAELTKGKYLIVRQEYYGEFVQSESSYFKPDKVDQMIVPDSVMLEGFKGECDLGVDFGGLRSSRSVLTISYFEEDSGLIRRIYHRAYAVKEDGAMLEDIVELKTRFNIQRVVVDQCPEGDYMIRDMDDKGWAVTPMVFARDKVKKYGEFRAKLNKGEGSIKSYPDKELIAEMKGLQQVEGRSRTQIHHANGMTDDLIDSFLMSAYHFIGEDDSFKFYDVDDEEVM